MARRGKRPVGKTPRRAVPAAARPGTESTVIVTVVGRNRPGVLAEVTTAIAGLDGNIMDISQKMLDEYFNLIMIVDIAGAAAPFEDFQKKLELLGGRKGYSIHVQHERVFRYMHRV